MAAEDTPEVDDPVQYFLDEQTFIGNSDGTQDNYRLVLNRFQDYLNDPEVNQRGERVPIGEANRRDCMGWIQTDLRDSDFNYADSTISSYASNLHGFFKYMSDIGAIDANPMVQVLRKMPESTDKNPARRDLSVHDMSTFIRQVHHPLMKPVVMTWLKTGMRHGELVNLDIRDVHINDPEIKDAYPELRPQLEDRPDTIFVSSDIDAGDVVNGEKRAESNKRKRDTYVPIDDELKHVLAQWLAVRPDTPNSDAQPFFTSLLHNWGKRLEVSTNRELLKKETVPYGWYSENADLETNVTPHYFRHFFTTHMRERSGDTALVKYIRGDVGDDIIDTYTHNWGNNVREAYEASIYKLL